MIGAKVTSLAAGLAGGGLGASALEVSRRLAEDNSTGPGSASAANQFVIAFAAIATLVTTLAQMYYRDRSDNRRAQEDARRFDVLHSEVKHNTAITTTAASAAQVAARKAESVAPVTDDTNETAHRIEKHVKGEGR